MAQASTHRAAEVRVIDIAPHLAGEREGKRRVAGQVDAACREPRYHQAWRERAAHRRICVTRE